ncbi:UDP-N-acetyl-D-mannosamine dehydrogenase [Arthrobacter sp. TB 23]|uniref:UDP-N-acetyl-D-mannosamine dehydrogenase n=1 Tax=Arthrobacter sp. TB 23 TaxID=494419 RepID=UPI00035D4341|nr:UDP-N-acetyl-D-mannosamine dehydrogenase [Arthrobacter sp. TB 23]
MISKVAVIGLGYIGLPTAAILATNGIRVVGVDVNQETVDSVNRGEVPFVEPDLRVHVSGAVAQGNLSASTETPAADVFIVAVPTPFNDDKSADLSYIESAARNIAPKLAGGELIILESTSPPGATIHLGEYLIALRPDLSLNGESGRPQILVAHCPERVLPGRVMIELVTNDRIIGGITREAAEKSKVLYEVFCKGEIHLTDATTAEMSKLVENSYRDVNIAFANELSMVSKRLGVDIWELISLANHHPRVNILSPGPGVGGHCIAVDPWFVIDAAPDLTNLMRAARQVNDGMPFHVVEEVTQAVLRVDNPIVAFLGLSYKANIDDLRQSPAVDIVKRYAQNNLSVDIRLVEKHIDNIPQVLRVHPNIRHQELDGALADANVVVLLVDHSEFTEVSLSSLVGKKVIDTRGVWLTSRELRFERVI